MQTIFFNNSPNIINTSSICGPKESQGVLKDYVDITLDDDLFNEKSYEKAETKMLCTALRTLIEKENRKIDAVICGDLLNQIIASSFSARELGLPYLGVYNACATFCESLIIGATLIDGGYYKNVISGTSSHFSSAERQYRYPLELGCTRPPNAQWTVTGAGCSLLSREGEGIKIINATVGKVVDYGVKDAFNMGAAMAPAACDTIVANLKDSKMTPNDYDLIVTGDLGVLGSRIVKDLVWEKGFDINRQHIDCGEIVYKINEKEYQGGSGTGCSSLVFNSYLYSLMKSKKIKKIMLVATGALLSSVSSQQGESIPGIAHAVSMEI